MSSVLGKERRETVLVGEDESAACCLCLHPSSLKPASFKRHGGWMWRVGLFAAPGLPDFRRQHVEVIALAETPKSLSPPPRPPRAIRSHRSLRWHDRLARHAWWGPPQLRITEAFVPAFLARS